MLSADKDLLLAKLNQDLLGLHLLELNTVLNRFQNAIGASSLLGGFAFAGIVELQLIDGENQTQLLAESVFYLSASLTLALAMFVMSVSTYASILGYRLSIQSTDQQSITRATQMLLGYYKWVLLAGVLALFTIIIASMAVVFFKAEKTVRWPATIIFLVSIPVRCSPPPRAPTLSSAPDVLSARPSRHSDASPLHPHLHPSTTPPPRVPRTIRVPMTAHAALPPPRCPLQAIAGTLFGLHMSMAGLDTLNVNSRVAMAADDGRSVRLAASRTQTGGRGRGGGSTWRTGRTGFRRPACVALLPPAVRTAAPARCAGAFERGHAGGGEDSEGRTVRDPSLVPSACCGGGLAEGLKRRLPCWRTPPHRPACCLPRPRPLLHTPERRLRSLAARRAPTSPPYAAPKMRLSRLITSRRRDQRAT